MVEMPNYEKWTADALRDELLVRNKLLVIPRERDQKIKLLRYLDRKSSQKWLFHSIGAMNIVSLLILGVAFPAMDKVMIQTALGALVILNAAIILLWWLDENAIRKLTARNPNIET